MQDAEDLVKKCTGCQEFANKPHAPASELKTIPLAWPLAQWGLDMVGPLKKSSPGGHTHLLVAVELAMGAASIHLVNLSTATRR